MKIYLAGKVGANDWRHDLVSGLRDAFPQSGRWPYDEDPMPRRFPILERSIFGEHDYVGPFFVSCDHGGFHYDRSHGVGAWDEQLDRKNYVESWVDLDPKEHPYLWESDPIACCAIGADKLPRRDQVVDLCLDAVRRADVVFAWLDDPTCHGTLVEIGYARAYGVPVLAAAPQVVPDLWFAWYGVDHRASGEGLTPESALRELIDTHNRSRGKVLVNERIKVGKVG